MRAGPIRRPVGLETEFGVLRPGEPGANAVEMSTQIVGAYADISRQGLTDALGDPAPPAHWDYEGEDPLADLRGGRLARAAAHPSQLTDNPWLPAPSPDADPGLTDSTGVDPGARIAPGGSAG
ncbi:proteasome accessory factor PafA2 family protein, partial [Actinomyces slackii]